MTVPLTVLILDDDEPSARQIAGYLTLAGHTARALNPGVAARHIVPLAPDEILLRVASSTAVANLIFCQAMTKSLPHTPILLYGPAPSADFLQRALEAGARRYLTIPLTQTAVLQALATTLMPRLVPSGDTQVPELPEPQPVRPLGTIVTVFSPKGGVGRTTLAVNTAISLRASGYSTVLVDAHLSGGTTRLFLNMTATSSLLDLARDNACADEDSVRAHLHVHRATGLEVLLAPLEPEYAEMVHGPQLQDVLRILQSWFDYIVVDTAAQYDEMALAALEMADRIVVPAAPDLAMLKNLVIFQRLRQLLGIAPEKCIYVLMRADSVPPQQINQIERTLGHTFDCHVVSDGRRATDAINTGEPLVTRYRSSRISRDLQALAEQVAQARSPGRRVPKQAIAV